MTKEPVQGSPTPTPAPSPMSGGQPPPPFWREWLKSARSVFSWDRLDTWRFRIILLIALVLAIGFFLTPGLTSETVLYDESWLDQISTADIRSPGDFAIEDHAATESKRSDAERAIIPLYDYHSNLGEEINVRIDKAFRQAQQILYDFIVVNLILPREEEAARKAARKGGFRPPEAGGEADKMADTADDRQVQRLRHVQDNIESYFAEIAKSPELSERFKAVILEARLEFNKAIQAVVPEEDYLQLFQSYFSNELLDALQRTVADVMSRKIISDKELMEKSDAGAVTIRMIGAGGNPPPEFIQRDTSGVLDFKEVNQSLWRFTNILSNLGKRQRELLQRLAGKLVQPNLVYNRALTMERRSKVRDRVKTMVIPVKKGEMIIRDGERFEQRHLTILNGIQRELLSTNPLLVMLGYASFFLVLISSLSYFAWRNVRKFDPAIKDYVMMASLLVAFILFVRAVAVVAGALDAALPDVSAEIYYLAIPVAVGAALVRIVLNSETASIFSIVVAVLFGMLASQPFFMSAYALILSFLAADAVGQCRSRGLLFMAGMRVSLVGMLLVVFYYLYTSSPLNMNFLYALSAAGASGVATGIILTGLTPIAEFLFDYTTDIKLLELANLNHPLLKRLIVQAPGTYHHCIIVGSLVESAAEYTHANPLLARVAAYYHDIGKIKTPQYFGENQPEGQNPHDSLSPNMSGLILQSHVKEGVELSRQFKLGPKITAIIAQHHGTSLMRYFYHKAKEHPDPAKAAAEEKDFRYGGPKPQTREAGLVMLADSVEAAARSLDDPTPERIQWLVQRIINAIFKDEQLNECELTLKDLHHIARAFTQTLVGIYHHRPKYPGSERAQEKAANGRAGAQSTKKTAYPYTDLEDEDDKDLRRLGMH
ncbi:MAG: HDIG domain-containing protein [Myxococcales bacterium]|nr:MAG: HDIG domain-containing protein [Myxococcales bacterium]